LEFNGIQVATLEPISRRRQKLAEKMSKIFPEIRTYTNKIFRRVFGLFWPLFDFKFGGLYTGVDIAPQRFESKIGSKEPKNRLKLFTGISSSSMSIVSKIFHQDIMQFLLHLE